MPRGKGPPIAFLCMCDSNRNQLVLFASLQLRAPKSRYYMDVILSSIYRMVMSSPPHPLMHFGMAGWLKIRNEETAYYKPAKPEESAEWPPKYWKFVLETDEEPKREAAFVDLRRFARIRLVDCAADQMRNVSPLVENGPDPVIDKDVVTEEWLAEKLGSKRVPVKALLLDQANISGIGNWVGSVLDSI